MAQAGVRNVFAAANDGFGSRQSAKFGTQTECLVQNSREVASLLPLAKQFLRLGGAMRRREAGDLSFNKR